MNGGWSPTRGRDQGQRPVPGGHGPYPAAGQPYTPHLGGPGAAPIPGFTYVPGFQPPPPPPPPGFGSPTFIPTSPFMMGSPVLASPTMASYNPYPMHQFPIQPNGQGQPVRQMQPVPSIDPAMPAAQMTNSTGGIGCEPGFNYFFPAKHTKVMVLKSKDAPWTVTSNTQIPYLAAHVPVNVTVQELMNGYGCTNPERKKNRVYEVVQGGNGMWYKGCMFQGDDMRAMPRTIKEVGWDETRGAPGGKPAVWLWFTKG